MTRRPGPLTAAVLVLLAWLAAALPTSAHDLPYTLASLTVRPEGQYRLVLHCHTAALVLGLPQGHLARGVQPRFAAFSDAEIAERSAEMDRYLRRRIEISVGGRRLSTPDPDFPDVAAVREDGAMTPETARLSQPVVLSGRLPAGARELTLAFPPELGTVLIKIERPGSPVAVQALTPGENSRPIALTGVKAGQFQTFVEYLALGFTHILPKGLDHILFVLALFLLTPRWKPLAIQVTAFTLAHSVTLALGTFGHVDLPARLVETAIALSIAVVAVDNLFESKLAPWRPMVVFGFGLLHGLGFAGVLSDLGIPKGAEISALVAFNLGVEFGQIAVLAIAFALLGWARERSWFRPRVAMPLSLAVAAIGLFWSAERFLA